MIRRSETSRGRVAKWPCMRARAHLLLSACSRCCAAAARQPLGSHSALARTSLPPPVPRAREAQRSELAGARAAAIGGATMKSGGGGGGGGATLPFVGTFACRRLLCWCICLLYDGGSLQPHSRGGPTHQMDARAAHRSNERRMASDGAGGTLGDKGRDTVRQREGHLRVARKDLSVTGQSV